MKIRNLYQLPTDNSCPKRQLATVAASKGLIPFLSKMADTFGQLDEVQIEIETGPAFDLETKAVSTVYEVVAGYQTKIDVSGGVPKRSFVAACDITEPALITPATGY